MGTKVLDEISDAYFCMSSGITFRSLIMGAMLKGSYTQRQELERIYPQYSAILNAYQREEMNGLEKEFENGNQSF